MPVQKWYGTTLSAKMYRLVSLCLPLVSSLRSFRDTNFVKVSSVALESAVARVRTQHGWSLVWKLRLSDPLATRVHRDAAMVSISPYLRPKGFSFFTYFRNPGDDAGAVTVRKQLFWSVTLPKGCCISCLRLCATFQNDLFFFLRWLSFAAVSCVTVYPVAYFDLFFLHQIPSFPTIWVC